MDYPKKAQKKPRKIEKKTVLVIRDGSRAAIRKRPAKGLLAGLYELPNLSGWLSQDEVLDWLETGRAVTDPYPEIIGCEAYFQSY